MTQPVRLQLSRRKGFDLQKASRAINALPATKVTRPGPWGNPFRIGIEAQTAADAVAMFRRDFRKLFARHSLKPLRGKNLACWCGADDPCHADVLLIFANR